MKNKRKTRKLSMVMKQMILIGAVVWIAVAIVVAIVTTTRRSDMVELSGDECIAVSTLLSSYIDASEVEAASTNEQIYNKLQAQLNQAMEDANMEYVYTLWTDGSSVYYGIDGSTEDPAAYGDVSEESYEYLAPAFNGTAVVDTELVKSDDGNYYITAYVPLVNEDGKVTSLLACDFNDNHVYAKILKAWRWLFIYATGGTLLAGGSVIIILNGTMKNILKLNDKVDELVYSNGDLTKAIDVKSGDEIENLANSINALMKYIRDVVVNISNNSTQVNEASCVMAEDLNNAQTAISDVSATMEEMSAGMEETNASLTEITDSVNSIYNEIVLISDKTEQSATYCNEVMNKANDISRNSVITQETAIAKTNQFANTIEEKIQNSKRVAEISELVNAIMQISTQTNLLSLNASIEAARAGESGRGFAVVADEIGKLANECKDSASRISEVSEYVIKIVNELAEESERMVEFARSEISSNCEQLKETSENYKNDVHEIGVLMQNFTASCEELKNVMDGIKESIGATNVAVEETTRGITNTAETMVTLSASAENIMAKANENVNTSGALDSEVNKFTF